MCKRITKQTYIIYTYYNIRVYCIHIDVLRVRETIKCIFQSVRQRD